MRGRLRDTPGVSLSAPELIALRELALQAQAPVALAALPGGFATHKKGRGLEVAGVREYVHGDDLRHLDRGATARTGRPHVREFQEERDRIVLLIADFRASMHWGISRAFRAVAAAEALTLIGWNTVEEGGRIGLFALTPTSPVIVPSRGRVRGMLGVIGGMVAAHYQSLNHMMQADLSPDQPIDTALIQAERLVPSGGEIIIASGFDTPGDGLSERLGQIARRRNLQLIHVIDAQTDRLPGGQYPIKLANGRQERIYLGGQTSMVDATQGQVAGRPALKLDAGDAPRVVAKQIATAFQSGKRL